MTQPGVKRCAQCGRTGTRQFRTLPNRPRGLVALKPITICANSRACQRRWPVTELGKAAARVAAARFTPGDPR